MPEILIDIGTNLTHDSFDPDREQVIERARHAGVQHLIITGSNLEHSRTGLDLCHRWPKILFCTAGIHPHHAQNFDTATPDELRKLLAQPEVVAVGECGLDYYRNFSPHPAQLAAFEAQLKLAIEIKKPVFLHQREAHQDFMVLMRHLSTELSCGVVHCFTGTEAELQDYLSLDLYIGITGWICDERRGSHLRELVKKIPENRLMLETDAPYLLPRDIRPRPHHHRNEPMYLAHICEFVATCLNKTVAQLADETTANARRFFNLASV